LRPGAPLVGLRAALGEMSEVLLDDAAALELARSGRVASLILAGVAPGALCAAVDGRGDLLAVLRASEAGVETVRVFRSPSCIPSRPVESEDARSFDHGPRFP